MKPEWTSESIGWFRAPGELAGAALVLYRQLPRLRRFLAYLPEGPVIDWDTDDLGAWLDPMRVHLAVAARFRHPHRPTGRHRSLERGTGQGGDRRRVGHLARPSCRPTERSRSGARVLSQLHELGWRHQGAEGGFSAGQPQYNFQIPLVDGDGRTRSEDDLLAGMNQQWRRNIKKAAKEKVEVRRRRQG